MIYEPAHFTELFRMAQLLKSIESWEVIAFFVREYPVLSRDVLVAEKAGFRVLLRDARPKVNLDAVGIEGSVPPRSLPRVRKVAQTLRRNRAGARVLNSFPFRLLGELNRYRSERVRARWLLRNLSPDLLVMAEENVAFEDFSPPLLIRTARAARIATLVIPYTVANSTEIAEQLYAWPELQVRRIPGTLVSLLAPHWIHEHRGRRILRMPAEKVLAREWTGTGAKRPWTFYSGEADAIAVESPRMLEYWRREEIPSDRLVLTGALYDDVLARVAEEAVPRRRELLARLGLPIEKPIVLSAIPPDHPQRLEPDFPDYRSLLEFWVSSLARLAGTCNVVLRLHPSMKQDDFRHLEREGVRIADQDTAALVPLADLYVASISATIRWAIACGIPVLNYDIYRFGYDDYDAAPGVLTISTRDEFTNALARLTPGTADHARLSAAQQSVASEWGTLDGAAARRMLALIEELIAHGTVGALPASGAA